jgi:hypothetical protein
MLVFVLVAASLWDRSLLGHHSHSHAAPVPATAPDAADAVLCNPVVYVPALWRALGVAAGWLSGVLYFTSRIFQLQTIRRNHRLRNGLNDGVSAVMFCITFSANLAYGVSVLMRTGVVDFSWFLRTFPFLLGSIGTLCFDAAILFYLWRDRKEDCHVYRHPKAVTLKERCTNSCA